MDNTNLENEVAKLIREPHEQVGRALKSVYERLTTDTTKEELDKLNIDYKGKTVTEVFEEISNVYKDLDNSKQLELAKKLGGTYNIAKTKAILDTMNNQ